MCINCFVPPQKILFISNGHGEDAIGARLAQELLLEANRQNKEIVVEAVPIVGRGDVYERLNGDGVRVLGPRWEPPSGGFTFTSLKLLWGDLRDGMPQKTHAQHWAVRNAKPDIVVVVGDVYALWVTFSFGFKADKPLWGAVLSKTNGVKPIVFQYQPLVSRHYQDGMDAKTRLERANRVTVDSFVAPELHWMRRVRQVFARDARTADWLRELGVPHASFVGNLMMDMLKPERQLDPVLDGRPVLALLPGTRDDFLFSLPRMLMAVQALPEFQVFAAFAGDATKISLPSGWSWAEPSQAEREASAKTVAVCGNVRVPLLTDAFAALLRKARVVLGTAGTANEQAVGLGVPVVGFATNGPQYTGSFARAQARLLADGLCLTEADAVSLVKAVRFAHTDEALRARVLQLGRERMGGAGGAQKIAEVVLQSV